MVAMLLIILKGVMAGLWMSLMPDEVFWHIGICAIIMHSLLAYFPYSTAISLNQWFSTLASHWNHQVPTTLIFTWSQPCQFTHQTRFTHLLYLTSSSHCQVWLDMVNIGSRNREKSECKGLTFSRYDHWTSKYISQSVLQVLIIEKDFLL